MTSTDLAVIEDEATEDALPEPLKATEAKKLDKQIRGARDRVTTDMEKLKELVDRAALGQIHVGLGLRSWTEWAKDALHFSFTFDQRLERKEMAKMLSEKGVSQHTIAKMLGVSQKTIDRDLEGVVGGNNGNVTAIDGRELPANRQGADEDSDNIIEGEIVDPEPEPPVTRVSVNEDFESEMFQLQNDIEALKEVIADERFPKQRKRIADKHLNTLQEVKAALEDIIDNVFGD